MEEMLKSFFVELVGTLGFFPTLVLLIALIVLISISRKFVKGIIQDIWNMITGAKKPKKLEDHLFFKKIDYLMNYSLDKVKTPCPLRKQIYIDAMKLRLQVYKEQVSLFIQRDLNKYSKMEFQMMVLTLLENCKRQFFLRAKEDNIPKFILDKLDEKVFGFYNIFYSEIKLFCSSDYIYQDNVERMFSILDLIMVKCEFYMNQFEKELASFNGELKNTTYKNIKCENCATCVHDTYLKLIKEEIEQENKNGKKD